MSTELEQNLKKFPAINGNRALDLCDVCLTLEPIGPSRSKAD